VIASIEPREEVSETEILPRPHTANQHVSIVQRSPTIMAAAESTKETTQEETTSSSSSSIKRPSPDKEADRHSPNRKKIKSNPKSKTTPTIDEDPLAQAKRALELFKEVEDDDDDNHAPKTNPTPGSLRWEKMTRKPSISQDDDPCLL